MTADNALIDACLESDKDILVFRGGVGDRGNGDLNQSNLTGLFHSVINLSRSKLYIFDRGRVFVWWLYYRLMEPTNGAHARSCWNERVLYGPPLAKTVLAGIFLCIDQRWYHL